MIMNNGIFSFAACRITLDFKSGASTWLKDTVLAASRFTVATPQGALIPLNVQK